jgi:PAS domain S-box-containing protein
MKDQSLRVLIVEDSENDELIIIRELKKGGYNPVYERVETASAMKKVLKEKQWDIILCDYTLPKFNAPSAIAVLKEANIDIPIIIVSGTIGEDVAAECMRLGAHDYIMKENLSRLCPAIARELEDAKVRSRQKQMEETLRKASLDWQITFDATSDAICLLDADQRIVQCNRTMAEMLGIKREDLIGRRCWEIVHGTMEAIPGCPIERMKRSLVREKMDVQKGDKWFSVTVDPILDEKRTIQGMVHIVRDITGRKRAEEALRESEKSLASIYNTVEDAIFHLAVEPAEHFRFVSVNPAFLKVTGLSSEMVVGRTVNEIIPEPSLTMVLGKYRQAIAENTIMRWEEISDYPSGRLIGIVSIAPVFDDKGACTHLVGSVQDITERRKTEEVQNRLAAMVESAEDSIIGKDLEGIIVSWNNGAEVEYGYNSKEVIGKSISLLMPPDNPDDYKEILAKIAHDERIKHYETRRMRKDGQIIDVSLTVSPIKDTSGKIIGASSIARNISERKLAEEELKKSKTLLESVFNSTQDLVLVVDRDLRVLMSNWKSPLYAGHTEFPVNAHCYEAFINRETPCEPCHALDVFNTGKPSLTEYYNQYTKLYKEVSAYPIFGDNNHVIMVAEHVRDITERKKAEEELSRLNRALRMLGGANEALIRIIDEAALLNEVCRIAVEVGGYRMAWIGFVEQDEAKTIRPVAHAGFDSGYIESVNITWEDNELGRGPGGIAIRTGLPAIARNILLDPAFAPWREAAIERGYKSNIALPLISEGRPFGELAIYSVEEDDFDDREVEILKEMSDDLAFGITTLRTRVRQVQTDAALRESEERYRLIAENTADTIAVFDLNLNPTYISPSITKLRGYTVQEAMTKTLDQMLTPDSLQQAMKNFADQMALESSPTADPARTALMELEEYCKDGSTVWVELAASFLRDNNFKPIGVLTVTRNIAERKQAEKRLGETLSRLRKSIDTTIRTMVSVVEMRDPYTAGHQLRVANLARTIATEMGLAPDKIDGIRMAGSIHDIGKLSIPAEILSKPTKLTEIEFSLIKEHPQNGYEMLKDVESPWPLAQIVHQHHERMDGSGYPGNLKGDEILIEARIMAVADVVEAMASHRPYRPTLGFREKGYQFK